MARARVFGKTLLAPRWVPRRGSGAGRAAADVLVNHARDGFLRGRADHALLLLAVLEEDERRDALDAVALRDRRVVGFENVRLETAVANVLHVFTHALNLLRLPRPLRVE